MTAEKLKACMCSSEASRGNRLCWQMVPEGPWAENMDVRLYAEVEEDQWLY